MVLLPAGIESKKGTTIEDVIGKLDSKHQQL